MTTLLSRRMLGLGLTAAAILGCRITTARGEDITVTIDNFTFSPAELTVRIGTTVTWKNHDDIPHTVVSAGRFKSKVLDTDDSYIFTFTSAGDYKYFCSLHPHMTGVIKVE
jgi:plastocyanin